MSSAFSYQATPSHTSPNGPAEQVLHFLPPLQQKGGETTGSPQKSSTPLLRLVIRPPKAPVSVKRTTPFTGKELFEIVQAAIKIKLFEAKHGEKGDREARRITSGKWDTRQRHTI